jgi:hypothetical protein
MPTDAPNKAVSSSLYGIDDRDMMWCGCGVDVVWMSWRNNMKFIKNKGN